MQQPSEPLENLIDQFSRFPGVGRKGATRMAYEVMSMPNEQAMELAKAIESAKTKLHPMPPVPGLYFGGGLPDLFFSQTGSFGHLRCRSPAGYQGY